MTGSSRTRLALRLNSIPWATSEALRRVWDAALERGEEEFLSVPAREAAPACGLNELLIERLFEEARVFDADRELARLPGLGARLAVSGEPGYPELLAGIPDSPILLYVQGPLPSSRRAAAIVGARRPTPYGLRMAARLASECAELGIAVASGLARGIDSAAHRAAVSAGGRTWAVLGSGLARLYPPENQRLAREILDSGGSIVSEFPLDAPPLPFHFPRRNRVISGLCPACVVVEGRIKSGSLITAKCALDQGRDVFAVPGPALSPLSAAPLFLIESGARPAARAQDLLDSLPPPPSPPARPFPRRAAAAPERRGLPQSWRKILRLLGFDNASFEEIREALANEDSPSVLKTLSEMEIDGLINRLPGQRYAQKDPC